MVQTDSNLFWVRKIISIQIWQHRSDAVDLQVLSFVVIIFLFYCEAGTSVKNKANKPHDQTPWLILIPFRDWILKKQKEGRPKSPYPFLTFLYPKKKRASTVFSLNCKYEQTLNTVKGENDK